MSKAKGGITKEELAEIAERSEALEEEKRLKKEQREEKKRLKAQKLKDEKREKLVAPIMLVITVLICVFLIFFSR